VICSGRNAKYVSDLGADEVIDYTKEDVAATLRLHRSQSKRDYDLIVDCVGGTDLLAIYASYCSPLTLQGL
jgi:NADPH:quinone reductase-like Zn-dependent oxidoreductase